jgi:hypothetical protein
VTRAAAFAVDRLAESEGVPAACWGFSARWPCVSVGGGDEFPITKITTANTVPARTTPPIVKGSNSDCRFLLTMGANRADGATAASNCSSSSDKSSPARGANGATPAPGDLGDGSFEGSFRAAAAGLATALACGADLPSGAALGSGAAGALLLAAGTTSTPWHWGHFSLLPTALSSTCKALWHCGQANLIMAVPPQSN